MATAKKPAKKKSIDMSDPRRRFGEQPKIKGDGRNRGCLLDLPGTLVEPKPNKLNKTLQAKVDKGMRDPRLVGKNSRRVRTTKWVKAA